MAEIKTKNDVFKNIAMEKIRNAIEEANAKGFKVIVASDEEGNNWNEINPEMLFYGDTKDKFIALSVYRSVDEEDAFESVELCEGCGEELLEGQSIAGDRHATCI